MTATIIKRDVFKYVGKFLTIHEPIHQVTNEINKWMHINRLNFYFSHGTDHQTSKNFDITSAELQQTPMISVQQAKDYLLDIYKASFDYGKNINPKSFSELEYRILWIESEYPTNQTPSHPHLSLIKN